MAARSDAAEAKNSPGSSSSFSSVLATYAKAGGEDDRGAAKPTKQNPETNSKDIEDGNAAALPAQPPLQQSLLTITGLLGFLRPQQPPVKDDSQPEEAAPDSNGDGAQAGSSAGPKLPLISSQALAASVLPALGMAKASPKAADSKTISSKHAAELTPPAFGIQLDLDPLVSEASDGEANSSAMKAGIAAASNDTPAGQTGNASAASDAAPSVPAAPLAFSMLISPNHEEEGSAASDTASGSAAAAALSTDTQHLSSALTTAAGTGTAAGFTNEHHSDAQPNPQAAPLAQAEGSRASSDRSAELEQPRAAGAAASDAAAETPPADPIRNLRLQVEGDNNQRVDVRLTEEGGELRVSVRSADPNLTQALQDHMPDLTNRLEQQHFRTEVWIPRSSETSDSGASNARSFHSSSGDSSGQQNPGRRQNGRENQQPNQNSEEDIPSQTTFQEITNQLWLQ